MDQVRASLVDLRPEAPTQTGWLATLELAFGLRQGRTALLRRQHSGPLLVQRAFYPEDPSVAHVYLLHPPGGVVGGDTLQLDVVVQPQARALLTTPGATKLYRCPGRLSELKQAVVLEPGAQLEWFPQETIVFSGAYSQSEVRVDIEAPPLGPAAAFVGWEIIALGRRGAAEPFETGTFVSRFGLYVNGAPLLLERLEVVGGSAFLSAPWGLRDAPVVGNFFATTLNQTGAATLELIERCRQLSERDFPDSVGEWRGLSALARAQPAGTQGPSFGCIVARYLGPSAERAKAWMVALWRILRPALLDREACLPRIWAT